MEILIFENSKQIAERLITLISEHVEDVTFFRAGSYAEAFYFFKECTPDTVLVDLKYPGNNGIELLKNIKLANDRTMVIALISETDEFSLAHYEQYGADHIFDKYTDFEKIPGIINAVKITSEQNL